MTVDMTKQGNTKLYSSVADWLRKANNETLISSITSETVKLKPLYNGFTLAVASTLPYSALSIPLYEFINGQTQRYCDNLDIDGFSMKSIKYFVPPTIVMCLLSTVLYPLETSKKIMQVNGALGHKKLYNSAADLFKTVSVKDLYRGYSLHIVKLVPYTFMHYSIYELTKAIMIGKD